MERDVEEAGGDSTEGGSEGLVSRGRQDAACWPGGEGAEGSGWCRGEVHPSPSTLVVLQRRSWGQRPH